jgi:hypothetical protein
MEVLSLEASYDASSPNFTTPRTFSFRGLKFSCLLSRVRFGLAAVESRAFMNPGSPTYGMAGFLPVYAGFDLYRNPKRTLLCYTMVPDIHVEGAWYPLLYAARQPCLRFTLNAEVEYYGIGAGLELGYAAMDQYNAGPIHVFGAGFRIRAITANFGLR